MTVVVQTKYNGRSLFPHEPSNTVLPYIEAKLLFLKWHMLSVNHTSCQYCVYSDYLFITENNHDNISFCTIIYSVGLFYVKILKGGKKNVRPDLRRANSSNIVTCNEQIYKAYHLAFCR